MSSEMNENIKCPECGRESSFTIWKSINTTIDPELYKAVRDGSLFMFKCPFCGCNTPVEYPTLYHQMGDKLMIQSGMSDENAGIPFLDQGGLFSKLLGGYTIRTVRSNADLREKLAIFDAGLDDRVIEIIKAIFLIQIEQQDASAKPDKALMYNNDEGKHMLAFFKDGTPVTEAEITDDIYAGVRAQTQLMLKSTDNDSMIDLDWAYRHIGE